MPPTPALAPVATGLSPVLELRQYRLHAGRRGQLLDLFERHFIAGQREAGIDVIGQFADLDDPDRFVWLRGFAGMGQRAEALHAFYDGPLWRQHREAANATMHDSDDVLLLRPARDSSAFTGGPTAAAGEGGIVEATILFLEPGEEAATVELFESLVAPPLAVCDVSVLGYFVSEPSPNNFPRLPIRGERVFVSFLGFADAPSFDAIRGRPQNAARWTALASGLSHPSEVRRPQPLGSSRLTGASPPCAAARAPIGTGAW